jgi:hypothetical protein
MSPEEALQHRQRRAAQARFAPRSVSGARWLFYSILPRI